MPVQTNSYSLWLAAQQNPICPKSGPIGPTGLPGTNGTTGSTGATGPAGQNGLTTGLEYYFYTEQPGSTYSPQPNVNYYGPPGFSMNIVPGAGPLLGNNPNPTYSAYNGYLAFMNSAGYTSNGGSVTSPSHLATFNLPLTGKSIVPAGLWTFSNNIYSYVTGSTTTIPFNMYITISAYTVATTTKKLIGGSLIRKLAINNPLSTDDTPYINSVTIPTTFTVNNPLTDYLIIEFYVQENYGFSAGQVIEFWSEGNSISQVVTTFSPQSGPTGAQGPTGSPGTNGVTGPTGQKGDSGNNGTGNQGSLAYYKTNNNNIGGAVGIVSNDGLTLRITDGDLSVSGNIEAVIGGISIQGASLNNMYNLAAPTGTNQLLGNITCNSIRTLSGSMQVLRLGSVSVMSNIVPTSIVKTTSPVNGKFLSLTATTGFGIPRVLDSGTSWIITSSIPCDYSFIEFG